MLKPVIRFKQGDKRLAVIYKNDSLTVIYKCMRSEFIASVLGSRVSAWIRCLHFGAV
jgi:hypothetical protein